MLLALFDGVQNVLEWIDQYGADKVFMVLFFLMYIRSQKKLTKLQDARLADSKEALRALIEAKHVFGELAEAQKKMSELIKHTAEDDAHFQGINERLDKMTEKMND